MNKKHNDRIVFTDPTTGNKLAAPDPKEQKDVDNPKARIGTAMTPAKPDQLEALAAKFSK